jgi:carboxyl-terminal processing protease
MERRFRLCVSLFFVWAIAIAVGLVTAEEPPQTPPAAPTTAPAATTPAANPTAADDAKKSAEDDYELYQIFADTLDQVQRNYVKDVSRRELMEAAIHGVLSKLDPYSNYISPEDISRFKTSVENQFGGIGIQIGMEDGQLKIISPLIGTPAYRAGLESGDAIIEIEGKSTDGIHIDEAVKQLKGEAGTKVTLTILHPGSTAKETMTITREWVHVETILGDHRNGDDRWDFMLDHDKHIGYVRILAFSRDTAQDLKKALVELQQQGLKGLIIDLRFNPGGLLTSAIEVSDLFIAEGPIVSTKGRNTPERVWNAQKDGTFEGFPMAVLVNHFSASASEILSACLQDHHRAVVIGERTWGKGSVQNVIELEGGKSALKLTTASYHRPSGKNIHRFPDAKDEDEWGVMPDPGFELKLNRSQTEQLILYRHDRDVLVGKHAKAVAAAKDPLATTTPATTTPATTTPATPPVATEPAKPETPKPEITKPEATKAESPADAKTPAKVDAKPEAAATPFADLQLQKAVDYLTQEFARAQ